jgi:hypothetical protein
MGDLKESFRVATSKEIEFAGRIFGLCEKFEFFKSSHYLKKFRVVYSMGVPLIAKEANILLLLFSLVSIITGSDDDSDIAYAVEPIYREIFSLYNVPERDYMSPDFRKKLYGFRKFLEDFFPYSLNICKEFGSAEFYQTGDTIRKIEDKNSTEFKEKKKSFLQRFPVPNFDRAILIPYNIKRYYKERKKIFGTSGPFILFIQNFEKEYNIKKY